MWRKKYFTRGTLSKRCYKFTTFVHLLVLASCSRFMNKVIKLKKGLDINLEGNPEKQVKKVITSPCCTIFPEDYPGFSPKLEIKVGDKVLAGDPILYDKNRPDLKISSPVSGKIDAVNRGEKRKLLSIIVRADEKIVYKDFGRKENPQSMSSETIKLTLAETGIMALIRQRPYDIVADPKDTPRDIFVPGFYSAPLAPDLDFMLEGQDADFQTGLNILTLLTEGSVYLGVRNTTQAPCLLQAENVEIVTFDGPHPVGNASVQINQIKPVNKGEIVWIVDPMVVVFIGRLFNRGVVDFTRIIALTGSEVNSECRAYYQILPGISILHLVSGSVSEYINLRYISGNVLTGTQIAFDGSLHANDNQITVIPEGNEIHEFVGWLMPRFSDFSVSKTYPALIIGRLMKKKYVLDSRIKGGQRAMIMSNEWDRVFPMDILPEFLIRAIIAFDVDKMENLGIYEVAPEDFALCEFVDTSKMELQNIVRKGLDLLYKEMI